MLNEQKKITINAVDYEVQAQWTIQMEQDYKAYFDLNIQALNIDTLAQQVAMDIDTRLIRLIDKTIAVYRNNPEVNKTFSLTPRLGFAGTNRDWYSEIYNPINAVSTGIELDTNLGPANIIAANPLGVHYLSMADKFAYKGDTMSGEMGRTPYVGNFANSWKVVSSPRIPKDKLYIINKADNMEKASAVFCPYRVMTVSPYPLGTHPNMTFLSRIGHAIIRKEGFGMVTIVD